MGPTPEISPIEDARRHPREEERKQGSALVNVGQQRSGQGSHRPVASVLAAGAGLQDGGPT